MTIEKLRPTYTFTEDRLAALQAVVPEAFADGRVNWATLREALGAYLEEESADAEHFGLSWPGKRAARRLAATPSKGTLRPVPGEGIDEATTRNLFIEGDNLEVLKLLQKSYAGRVKLIYIDPPYNTGNDFIYKDDFSEPLDSYLRRTGQTGEEGELLTTNPKAGGRFHSNWLNMMYPRLLLARQLLRDDGLIFVSIDDNELANLRILMDEALGAENFVANIAWEKRYTRSNNARMFYSLKDSLLVYRKTSLVSDLREPRTGKSNSIYNNPDNDPRDVWTSSSYVNPATKQQRPNLVYPIVNPFTGHIVEHPTHAWKYEKKEHERHVREKRLWWGKSGDAIYPRLKVFLSESDDGLVPIDLWDHENTGTTDEGGNELKTIFGQTLFDNPKPTKLISRILKLCSASDSDDIILDFFSGSATTAQAVLEQNQDGGNRRFILVQLPEPTNNPQFPTIAEIGKERIRRVIGRMKEADADKQISERETPEDLGFKVFKLGRSHFKEWSFDGAQAPADDFSTAPTLFDAAESPLVANWQPEDLLIELMLQEGFPLDSRVTVQEFYQQNWVWQVESEACAHRLFVCLDAQLHADTIAGVERIANGLFLCLDTALSDEAKVRLSDGCRLKVI